MSGTITSPRIVSLGAMPYVLEPHTVTLPDLAAATRQGLASVAGLVAARELVAAGAPFVRYRRIDMAGTLDIETGIPILQPDDRSMVDVRLGLLPAGRYASLIHTGPYDGLLATNAALIRWGEDNAIRWAVRQTNVGQVFSCRLEMFHTGPDQTPDPASWVTEVAILIAEDSDTA